MSERLRLDVRARDAVCAWVQEGSRALTMLDSSTLAKQRARVINHTHAEWFRTDKAGVADIAP